MESDDVKSKKAWCYGDDPYHFGIHVMESLKPHHLHALIGYTDFTELCTKWSGSFRKLVPSETINDVKRRHSAFYWCSRYLRELITYYGKNNDGSPNGIESGPFFSGVSVV